MSGKRVLKIEHLAAGANAGERNQEFFKNLFDYFELQVTEGQATRIALYWGNGATGTNYFNLTDPFGENAFAVYEFPGNAARPNPFTVLIQWSDAQTLGAQGGPAQTEGSLADGTHWVAAQHPDTASPWTGTTNNDGTDTKNNPVWRAGSITTSRDNETPNGGVAGPTAANRETLHSITDLSGAGNHRYHIVGDADFMAIAVDQLADGTYLSLSFLGAYKPSVDLPNTQPLMGGRATTITPTGTISEGAASSPVAGENASWVMRYGINDAWFNSISTANSHASPAISNVFPMYVDRNEGVSEKGIMGSFPPEIISCTGGIASNDACVGLGRVFFASTANLINPRIGFVWDGVTSPGAGVTREGIVTVLP